MFISKSLLNNPTGTRLFCVYSLNFYKLKPIKHQMRLAEPSICCAVRLQMVALKVEKKGTSKVDYCQIAETPTAEAGPKH